MYNVQIIYTFLPKKSLWQLIYAKFEGILDKHLPKFVEQPKSVDLKLPKLKKVGKPKKIELPKLKKVNYQLR